ncbi:MAG: hypothetical protein WCG34_08745 [Leptolinea sp.]
METEEKGSRFETVIAILIAIVAVLGAVVAWRSSVMDDGAGDADYAGLRAAVNAEETRAINYVNAYESYGNYVSYWRNNRQAKLLSEEILAADKENSDSLIGQMKISNDLADANRNMFETRFLNRDGSYNVQRQMGEMWADAAKEKDLEYESQFTDAEKLRLKTNQFLLAMMILGLSLVFYSLVESMSGRWKYFLVGLGSVFAIAGIVFAVMIELGKL